MRCNKYYVDGVEYNRLPKYLTLNGGLVPTCTREGELISTERMDDIGILIRVDAAADAGKMIINSHGELIDGQWTEVIDKQMTLEEYEAENMAAEIAGRSTEEKLRDNKCLDLIAEINTLAPDLSIQVNETCEAVLNRAIMLGLDSDTTITTKLLTLERLVKGVTLPLEKHVIE